MPNKLLKDEKSYNLFMASTFGAFIGMTIFQYDIDYLIIGMLVILMLMLGKIK